MARYTQDNRPMRVDTRLGRDVLLLERFRGVEGVSLPFRFDLELMSETATVDPQAMLRSPVLITFDLPGGGKRFVHGLVRRFVQLGQRDDLTFYSAEVVPWLWFLTLSRECRIHQQKSALDIIETVFTDAGWADFEFRCKRSYGEREYCVQYRETHFDFVSRLMEEEGISWFFEHSDERHVLVLTDDTTAATVSQSPSARFHPQRIQFEDIIWSIEREHAVHTGAVALRDYDFLQPSLLLENSLTGEWPEELYDYPGNFLTLADGDRYARIQLEAQEALQQTLRGESNCRGFGSGFAFDLAAHYRKDTNGKYLLLRVEHSMQGGDYRSWNDAGSIEYSNQFVAIPASTPFRPLHRTARPRIHGTQTALVVGPGGAEIHVDNYGRVKVQFYWDRKGGRNEGSSCWVRVSSPWAGKGYGGVSIPRIGNEVVVAFLEGDPDRPLIVGSVYNDDQMPPFTLPDSGIQMGMKSRSSPGGGGYNEITLEDSKGKEQITIHGQFDMSTKIEHDNTISIGNDESTNIGADRSESVGGDEAISIDGQRSENVGKNESIAIGGNRTESVGGNEGVTIGGNRNLSIGGNDTIEAGKDRTTAVGKKETLTIGDLRSVKVAKDDTLQVGKKLVISAGDQIQIKTGSASITMKKDGTITIKGKDINLSASGKINAKASSTVTLKGSQIKEN